jgi:hypothetical protein
MTTLETEFFFLCKCLFYVALHGCCINLTEIKSLKISGFKSILVQGTALLAAAASVCLASRFTAN